MKSTEMICSCCRQIKTTSNFPDGYAFTRKMPVCKDCVEVKLEKYENYVGRIGAFWLLCAEFGLPFIQEAYNNAYQGYLIANGKRKGVPKGEFPNFYIKKLKQLTTVYEGFWDSDTMLDDILNKSESEVIPPEFNLDLMQKRWGKYPDGEYNEAYSFLESTYKDYTENLNEMDANTQKRYRDLCKAEYVKRKADENGDPTEIAKAQSNLLNMLKLLKLDNFQEQSTDPRERFIDRLIWQIEQTEPAEEEDLKKYRDIAGFEKAFSEIMRSMRNLIAGTREYPEIPKEER